METDGWTVQSLIQTTEAAVGILVAASGVSIWLYRRIRRRSVEAPISAPAFPPVGRHGKNVLAPGVRTVSAKEQLSLRADIPVGSDLRMEFIWPLDLAGHPFELGAVENWIWEDLKRAPTESRSVFYAEPGRADLSISISYGGDVTIEAYASKSHAPVFRKSLHVVR